MKTNLGKHFNFLFKLFLRDKLFLLLFIWSNKYNIKNTWSKYKNKRTNFKQISLASLHALRT